MLEIGSRLHSTNFVLTGGFMRILNPLGDSCSYALKQSIKCHTRLHSLPDSCNAVGPVLFFFRFYRKADLQKDALRQQLKLAVDLNLPIILHCREGYASIGMDADQDLMNILREVCL